MDRTRALGEELVRVHGWLRTELARLRDEIDDHAGGDAAWLIPLGAHCAAFCLALAQHHGSEDSVAFPALAERYPELAPVLEELRRDHALVADILRRLRELLDTLAPDNADRVRGELDGLAAILESHFQWEERRLTAALDALDTEQTTEELLGAEPPTREP